MLEIASETLTMSAIQWDYIIGGLALFLFGIDFMGDGLKKLAGEKLKDYIDKFTNKPWKGMIVGCIVTCLIQSSSATSSIAIGFVRAGLMTLEQSVGIIIGANIGTTITAFLIGLKVEAFALYFVFIGVLIQLFAKRKKTHYMGDILFGFGVLFFGLRLMGDELSILGDMPFFTDIAVAMQNMPWIGFVLGIAMTAVVQSSSAVVGIIQKIYDSGALTLGASLPFVFGSSIGTTVTGVIASIGGSTSARRSALINVLYNTFGAVVFMFILTPYTSFIIYLSEQFNIAPMMQIAVAHIIRASVIALLQYPFIPLLVNIIKKLVPGDEGSIELNLDALDPSLATSLPAGALDVSKQATVKMGELAAQCLRSSQEFFNSKSSKHQNASKQLEDAINSIDSKITEYLMTIAHNSLNDYDTDHSIANLQVIKEIERVGDLTMNLNEFYEMAYEDKGTFTDSAIEDINEMYKTILEMNEFALKHFMTPHPEYLEAVIDKENYLDLLEEKARQRHFKRMTGEICGSGVAASIFVDILGTLERIGDHVYNIVKEENDELPAK